VNNLNLDWFYHQGLDLGVAAAKWLALKSLAGLVYDLVRLDVISIHRGQGKTWPRLDAVCF
jgi:hypothetical protein